MSAALIVAARPSETRADDPVPGAPRVGQAGPVTQARFGVRVGTVHHDTTDAADVFASARLGITLKEVWRLEIEQPAWWRLDDASSTVDAFRNLEIRGARQARWADTDLQVEVSAILPTAPDGTDRERTGGRARVAASHDIRRFELGATVRGGVFDDVLELGVVRRHYVDASANMSYRHRHFDIRLAPGLLQTYRREPTLAAHAELGIHFRLASLDVGIAGSIVELGEMHSAGWLSASYSIAPSSPAR
ncbi:MAG: hypothetical protein K8M05_03960 [Deltaproteobacteria bacterium]|nr:hypothetical protein [Kofleriaceae bacterium]